MYQRLVMQNQQKRRRPVGGWGAGGGAAVAKARVSTMLAAESGEASV